MSATDKVYSLQSELKITPVILHKAIKFYFKLDCHGSVASFDMFFINFTDIEM